MSALVKLTIFVMKLLDLPDEMATMDDVVVELIPPCQFCESRTRKLG